MANAQDFWHIIETDLVFDILNFIKNAFKMTSACNDS